MFKDNTEVELPLIVVMFMVALIILSITMTLSFGIQNKRRREVIEVYEEYYIIDKEMDVLRREWVRIYQSYDEEEFYLKHHTKTYLRYLELEKKIGEFENETRD